MPRYEVVFQSAVVAVLVGAGLGSSRLQAAAYYVATNGLDSNPGTLDAAHEWHHQNSTLYLWPPGGDHSTNHVVEAKRRAWCVDLTQRSWIVLDGLKFFGGSLRQAATNRTVRNCQARYLSHFTHFPWPGWTSDGGVELPYRLRHSRQRSLDEPSHLQQHPLQLRQPWNTPLQPVAESQS